MAMAWPWQCHGWQCHGIAMAWPRHGHGNAMPWQCHGIATTLLKWLVGWRRTNIVFAGWGGIGGLDAINDLWLKGAFQKNGVGDLIMFPKSINPMIVVVVGVLKMHPAL